MTLFLRSTEPDFQQRFDALVQGRRDQPHDVQDAVRSMIAAVRERGDAAVFEFTERFDRVNLAETGLAIAPEELEAAWHGLAPDLKAALQIAHERIEKHHRRQLPADDRYTDDIGAELGHRWTPLDSVGLYVPGGKASYPSSVLMNAVPAKVAGVPRLVMVVPTPKGEVNPAVLAAAHLAGIREVYRIGGAQAVAALAYGTETIKPVVKIVGPGNAWVAEAKRQVFGVVGIDMIAGPSEVVAVADDTADPVWLAADLLAQAEHDEAAQSILITDSPAVADATAKAVDAQLGIMPRGAIAAKSWADHGAVLIVRDLAKEAPPLVNALAPEHLELACDDAEGMLPAIRNAGAIFIGHFTPEAVGDYVGGSNHVLPTSRAARFSSGLGVLDYMKRTSLLKLNRDSLGVLAAPTMTLAEAEGLFGHRRSVAVRTNGSD
ncbi:histidinol dehydrogenase [Rhodomicrobium sp. Az07]|uniref:histidinol dehydrogenase n=1 Tax=Rhodomicrobium sp. Az07 TaxID=2839034 RepID=UPI001BEAF272|nr:histidinol dehydrogenase [Rhodomicrobium sp. Az07]MBT3070367.1 histidinol dehydrogenase [Rhodomicrobium sp. Az07]